MEKGWFFVLCLKSSVIPLVITHLSNCGLHASLWQKRDIDSLCSPHPPGQGFALTDHSSHYAALAHARPCLGGRGWRTCILLDLDLLALALDPAQEGPVSSDTVVLKGWSLDLWPSAVSPGNLSDVELTSDLGHQELQGPGPAILKGEDFSSFGS